MSTIFGILSIALGAIPFLVGYGAGAPVLGIAFAAAGVLRESRAAKKNIVPLVLNLIGGLLSFLGIALVLFQTYKH